MIVLVLELTTYRFQPGATPRNKLSNKNIKYELARYILPPHVFRTCILYPLTFLEPKLNLRLCSHLCVSRLRRISLKHRKKEVRKSERHVSLKRGARESVHPSARWSLFTMTMLIPRVFSDIDPNFTISMRSTNFSFFSHHSCRSNPWSCARYSSEQWHVPICRRGRSSTGRRKENRGVAGRLQWSSETGSC